MKKKIYCLIGLFSALTIFSSCQKSKTEEMLSNICGCFSEYSTVAELENASVNQITEMQNCIKEVQKINRELLKDLPRDQVESIQEKLESDMESSDCREFLKEL